MDHGHMGNPPNLKSILPIKELFLGGFLCLAYALIIYSDFFFPWGAPAGGDILSLHLPSLMALKRSMLAGNPYPMWWQEVLCGVPAIPDISATLLNPLYLLLYWLEPLSVIKLQVLLCLVSSGWGLFLLCRQMSSLVVEKRPVDIVLFSMVFLGLTIFHGLLSFGHLGILSSVSLFIWSLISLNSLIKHASWFNAFPLGLIFGLGWLTGHPQFSVMTHELTFIWMLLQFGSTCKSKFKVFFIFSCSVLIGALIGSPQLYATFLHISETGRAATLDNQDFLSSGALTPLHLFRWCFPFAFGNAHHYWGQFTFYMGLPWGSGIWLILFILGWKGQTWQLKTILIYTFIMAFGYQTFLYDLHQEILPGAKLFRFPSRYIYMLIPFMMVFCYTGIHRVIKGEVNRLFTSTLFSLVALNLTFHFIPLSHWSVLPEHVQQRAAGKAGPNYWSLLISTIPILLHLSLQFKKGLWPFLIILLTLQTLISLANPFSNVKLHEVPQEQPQTNHRLLRSESDGHWRNLGLLQGELTIEGYSGLVPKPFRELVDTQAPQDFSKHNRLQLQELPINFLDFLGVQGKKNNPQPMVRFAKSFQPLDLRKNSVFSEGIQTQQHLIQNDFKTSFSLEELPESKGFSIDVLKSNSDHWEFNINNSEPGVLILTDNHHSLWKSTIGGMPTQIKPWLGSFKAIILPAGEHSVEFFIPKKSFFIFLGISIFSIMLSLSLTIRRFNLKR